MEGWYDPHTGEVLPDNHWMYYQYNLTDIPDPFYQEEGTIYWLEICTGLDPNYPGTDWGWKSSENHWNDDAVWRDTYDPNMVWHEMFEPSDPNTDTFWIYINPDGTFLGGGGSGYNGGEWFYYPDTGWWNQWFYDGVFDPERDKVINIAIDLVELEPAQPSYIEFAVNYSTPEWSALGHGDAYPPIPGAPGFIEDEHIVRVTLLEGEVVEGFYEFTYVIRDYNPEWVSVDVRGYNISIGWGRITHDCRQSLDLAFVITGQEEDCPNPGASGNFCTADCYPNNGDGIWNYPADDGDCLVDLSDLSQLLANYGMTTGATREHGDVYPVPGGDSAVGLSDLSELLSQYADNCN